LEAPLVLSDYTGTGSRYFIVYFAGGTGGDQITMNGSGTVTINTMTDIIWQAQTNGPTRSSPESKRVSRLFSVSTKGHRPSPVNSAPQWRRSPVEGVSTHVVVGKT
jgi:hypothetical protein